VGKEEDRGEYEGGVEEDEEALEIEKEEVN